MEEKIRSDEYQKVLAQESKRSRAESRKLLSHLSTGEINFDEFLSMLNDNTLKSLRSKKVFEIMSVLQGWTQETALQALIEHGVEPKTAVHHLLNNEANRRIVTHIISLGAHQWHRRVEAPAGFPWFGNVLDVLNQIDSEDLPKEYKRTAYFSVDENPASGSVYRGEDQLDELFGDDNVVDIDSPEEDDDDFLSDLMGDSAGVDEHNGAEGEDDDFLDDLLN